MYSITRDFYQKIQTERPFVVIAFINEVGMRVFSDVFPSDAMVGFSDVILADGSHKADGSATAGIGSEAVVERFAIVESFGTIYETLDSRFEDMLGSRDDSQLGTIHPVFLNKDNLWAKIRATENILNAMVETRVQVKSHPGEYLSRFKGTVQDFQLTRDNIELEVRGV